MRRFLLITITLTILATGAYGQKPVLNKSKQPTFAGSEWVADMSEGKIYDDDLIFGRLKFKENKVALDSIASLAARNPDGRLNEIYTTLDESTPILEVGDGKVDFYSTKFKKKHTCNLFYMVVSGESEIYLILIIDIEHRGDYHPLTFMIQKIQKGKGEFEVQLLDENRELSDIRLVRVK